MTRRIEVVPYDPQWPLLFEEEAAKIKQALGNNCIAIHHIGSTSVMDLCAKPKIDILAVIKETSHLIQDLESLGYLYKGEHNILFRFSFSKRESAPHINLHVFEEGNPEIELNLLFRDFLRQHPEIKEKYAALKLDLVSQKVLHEKGNNRFSGYNLGKDKFIKDILTQAGFQGLCMRLCTHYDEWEAARIFRQEDFFDKVPISDPYIWTFNHPNHVHLVFYKGTDIIGYAHLQLWQDKRAALRIIIIEKQLRHQGLGSHFLKLCERWLKRQGYASLHTLFLPKTYPFYNQNGYVEMPFNDPEEHESSPQEVEMGKIL
jgi:GrpB-like predicted nucleotidyltransferase (UPF0157 family)